MLRQVLSISAILLLELCSLPQVVSALNCTNDPSYQVTIPNSRAQDLGLTQAWEATMPCSENMEMFPSTSGVENSTRQLKTFITDAWGVRKGSYFYGIDDLSFVHDPFLDRMASANTTSVLRVLYKERSYSPTKTSEMDSNVSGGVGFYMTPFKDQSFKRGLLRYDVAFADDFDWVKGGKLPGIYGGNPSSGCSGGTQASGTNCVSVRLMWRQNGEAEAYAYLPSDSGLICDKKSVICNNDYGTSLARGKLRFQKSKWSKIEIYTELNDIGKNNGVLKVWQDDKLTIDVDNLTYRHLDSFGVSSIMFNTFYGGSTPDYAATGDTYTYYKSVQFAVDTPETPVKGSGNSICLPVPLLFLLLFSNAMFYVY